MVVDFRVQLITVNFSATLTELLTSDSIYQSYALVKKGPFFDSQSSNISPTVTAVLYCAYRYDIGSFK